MAEAHPAATKRRADSQTVGGLREDTEDSSIVSDSDSSDDWTNKSFDDVDTAAKAKDDRWSGEDEPEQDEIPQPQTRQSLDSRSGAKSCLLYTSPSPRDGCGSRMPSSA